MWAEIGTRSLWCQTWESSVSPPRVTHFYASQGQWDVVFGVNHPPPIPITLLSIGIVLLLCVDMCYYSDPLVPVQRDGFEWIFHPSIKCKHQNQGQPALLFPWQSYCLISHIQWGSLQKGTWAKCSDRMNDLAMCGLCGQIVRQVQSTQEGFYHPSRKHWWQ